MSTKLCTCLRCNCQKEAQGRLCEDCMNGSHYAVTALSHACKSGKHGWCLESAYNPQTSSTGKCGCDCHKTAKDNDLDIL